MMKSTHLLSGLVCGVVIAALFGQPARAQDNDWINQAFTPKKPKETTTSFTQRHSAATEALKRFAALTFLGVDDTKAYQQNIQALIGNYFFVSKTGGKSELQLIGKGDATIKEIKTEIKDGVIFRAIVQQKWSAGTTLPFLAIKLGKDEIAEITIQDNVAVVTDKAMTTQVSCSFPIGWETQAKASQFYFITAAAVSSVTSRRFGSTSGEGNGAFSIIKLDGKYFYSDEEMIKQNVVSIAKIPVQVLTAEQRQLACKKADPVKKEELAPSTLRLESLNPTLLPNKASDPVLRSFDTVIPELSGKIMSVKPGPRF